MGFLFPYGSKAFELLSFCNTKYNRGVCKIERQTYARSLYMFFSDLYILSNTIYDNLFGKKMESFRVDQNTIGPGLCMCFRFIAVDYLT